VNNLSPHQRGLRWSAALLLFVLPTLSVEASSHKSGAWASSHLEAADKAREAFNNRGEKGRARRDYQRLISAYRKIYYGSPASSQASTAVLSVAQLLAEMGSQFDDKETLHSAIQQYEFLRREYPSSRYRAGALFAIAQIYRDDLGDRDRAHEVFEEFIRRYPGNDLAEDARKALADTPAKSAEKNQDETFAAEATNAEPSGKEPLAHVTGIRHWSTPDYTRVAIDLDRNVKFESQRIENPARVYFDLANAKLDSFQIGKIFNVDDGFLKQIRIAQYKADCARIVLDVDSLADFDSFLLSNPARLIIDIRGKETASNAPAREEAAVTEARPLEDAAAAPRTKKVIIEPESDNDLVIVTRQETAKPSTRAKGRKARLANDDAREARPTADGDRSLIRALGLKIGKIVIDPGHGGHDTGTIGPHGLLEKDLVLDVSRRLAKLLDTRMGADVLLTRSDDTFVPLETRTAIANQEQADLFVSVHANSSRDADARGVETYYLNFTSSPEALEVAARENAVSEKSIHELQDLVKKIALKEKIEESHEFAANVQQALHNSLSTKSSSIRDRGVKKAPFIVLIGANMPSILAEISFVSNPTDERKLRTPEYRQRIAESLYKGISKYVGGLSGVKVASRVDKGQGP
jgi:N-acetylmuramoyl-L-alanine amidase